MTAPAVYLASKSPRREELLRQLGIEFASLRLRESSARERDIVEGAHDAEVVVFVHGGAQTTNAVAEALVDADFEVIDEEEATKS